MLSLQRRLVSRGRHSPESGGWGTLSACFLRPFGFFEAALGPQRCGSGTAAEFVGVEAPGHSREPAGGAQGGGVGVGGETPGGADFP